MIRPRRRRWDILIAALEVRGGLTVAEIARRSGVARDTLAHCKADARRDMLHRHGEALIEFARTILPGSPSDWGV